MSAHRIICDSKHERGLSEVPLSCIATAHSSNNLQEMGSRGRQDVEFQGGKYPILNSISSSLVYSSAVMYTKTCTSEGRSFKIRSVQHGSHTSQLQLPPWDRAKTKYWLINTHEFAATSPANRSGFALVMANVTKDQNLGEFNR